IEAASKLRDMLLGAVAEQFEVPAVELSVENGKVWHESGKMPELTFEAAIKLAETKHGSLTASGSYRPPKLGGPYKGSVGGPRPPYSYSACVVELDCDPETGWITVDKVWIAHDIGRAINPVLVEGQCEGSVYMALGEALMEEQDFRGARGPRILGVLRTPSML